uniref:Uncharacterized protein n=1 Tax=Avena sativa TaxID=4498 RepID=A0ACD5YVG4_AVESA
MVRPPGTLTKRRAASHAPPAGGVVNMEAEEAAAPPHKRVRPVQQSPPPHQHQDMYGHVIVEPPPLGLQLRKSDSFLDLIQKILSKPKSDAAQSTMDNIISKPPMKKYAKSRSVAAGERLKASNFTAKYLKIGNWEYTPQHEGDLMAKCYYAKHKLVWEVLDAGLKSKIELQWSSITSLKATYLEDGEGTLDLVLSRPPIFYQETDPQPRKHTLWQLAPDFTGGQASLHRRHILRCSQDVLSKNFENIIRCDQRLYELSQQQVIILDSPFFDVRSSLFEIPNESDGPSAKFRHFPPPCVVPPVFENDGVNVMLKQTQSCSQPMNLDVQENYVAHQENNNNLSKMAVSRMRSSMSMEDMLNHMDNCRTSQRAAGNPQLPNVELPSKELFELAERLWSDTYVPPSVDEKYLMARENSLCCLLDKDTAPSTDAIDEKLGSAPAERSADGTISPIISRNTSFGDLLQNLPHIASVSQLLFDIEEDLENSNSHS